jgi:toxin HigB-1
VGCNAEYYIRIVIRNFRHKGLDRFFTKSEHKGIDAKHADRIRRILDRLDAATSPEDMILPGLKFHGLSGNRKGTCSVWVSGNWRITFRFAEGDAIDVNLEDYHS